MKRPFGITILAIIFAAAGLSYMMLGFQMTTAVTFGPLPSGQGTWIWGWLIVLTGLAFWAGGLAAWRLEPWGWMLGHSGDPRDHRGDLRAPRDRQPELCPGLDGLPVPSPLVPEPAVGQNRLRHQRGIGPTSGPRWIVEKEMS